MPLPQEFQVQPVTRLLTTHAGIIWAGTASGGILRYDGSTWSPVPGPSALTDTITQILEDAAGNIWVATADSGVARFDGTRWTRFTDDSVLCSSHVRTMLVDRDSVVWIGTDLGCTAYRRGVWRCYDSTSGLTDDRVTTMYLDRDNRVLVGSISGVARFANDQWETIPADFSRPMSRGVVQIVQDGNGDYWFRIEDDLEGGGLVHFDPDSSYSRPYDPYYAFGLYLASMCVDGRGRLWLGGDGGEAGVLGDDFDALRTGNGPLWDAAFTSIMADAAGGIWLGTGTRLARITAAVIEVQQGPPYSIANAINDRYGNLWCTGQGAVYRFDGEQRWKTHTQQVFGGFGAPNGIDVIYGDNEGLMWCAVHTLYAGITVPDTMAWDVAAFDGGAVWGTPTRLTERHLTSVAEEPSRRRWFGTLTGLLRVRGSFTTNSDGEFIESDTVWTSFTREGTAGGLASDSVLALARDATGTLWVGTTAGVSRLRADGQWDEPLSRATTRGALLADTVAAICAASDGSMWFGTDAGVSRLSEGTWQTAVTSGRPLRAVSSIAEYPSGTMWFVAGDASLWRYSGGLLERVTSLGGFPLGSVSKVLATPDKTLWLLVDGNVLRYESGVARLDRRPDIQNPASSMVFGTNGTLWLGVEIYDVSVDDYLGGVTVYTPDAVSPRTLFLTPPAAVSGRRELSFVMGAAYGESRGLEWQYAIDDTTWTAWSSNAAAITLPLSDGLHRVIIRSRDEALNVDPTAAESWSLIDATPPVPTLAPIDRTGIIHGTVTVQGSTIDERFLRSAVEVRLRSSATWTVVATETIAKSEGVLCTWDTRAAPDGEYVVRLSVVDSLGLEGVAEIQVIVDNQWPYANQTTPARILAPDGGSVYSTNGEVHLYFPPHTFSADATVSISLADTSNVPAALPSGARRIAPGYIVDWGAVNLTHSAVQSIALSAASAVGGGTPAIYRRDSTGWMLVGGTVQSDTQRLESSLTSPGHYAAFAGGAALAGGGLSRLALSPRVWGPQSFGADVNIGFTLNGASNVDCEIYNRAGRLIRDVAADLALPAGANVLRWDGRNRDGNVVQDGLYMVIVRCGESRLSGTVAVAK